MEVTCTQCQTKLNIPDEKIPKDQAIKVSCPKCKNKITIDSRASTRSEETEKSGEIRDDYTDSESLDFFDENTKLALVLADDDIADKVKTAVEGLGYKYIHAPNTRDALAKLRFHRFDIIFIAEGFDGQELENSPIRNYLNTLAMSSRRRIFLALMGDRFKSLDDMTAYTMSANTVISTKDVDKLPSIFKQGISEHEKFYKVFMDTLVEVGKA
ncbi:MAG: hypothetical protein A2Z39_02760 [Deltaproteobacteria bacterium RBG_19FT_COMBO_46_9]|nr:MAG: hypothetical protein A2Z39_02760 [Deltaproteobacteria bacterium RBG_19FT_COMBO_46_9]